MHVRQMSISYLAEQDRILVRVNTQESRELQFWCTRRLTLGLAPLLERLAAEAAARRGGPATTHLAAADPATKKALADFNRSESMRSADFATPYQVDATNQPLFTSPLLLTEVNVAPLANGALRLRCVEKLGSAPAPRTFELVLSESLMHAFMHLLERAVASSGWRGAAAVQARAEDVPEGNPAPGYLN